MDEEKLSRLLKRLMENLLTLILISKSKKEPSVSISFSFISPTYVGSNFLKLLTNSPHSVRWWIYLKGICKSSCHSYISLYSYSLSVFSDNYKENVCVFVCMCVLSEVFKREKQRMGIMENWSCLT